MAGDWGSEEDAEGAEETADATMISVEEMLEGYEWASDDVFGRKSVKGAADLVEARLLDELMALDKVGRLSFSSFGLDERLPIGQHTFLFGI